MLRGGRKTSHSVEKHQYQQLLHIRYGLWKCKFVHCYGPLYSNLLWRGLLEQGLGNCFLSAMVGSMYRGNLQFHIRFHVPSHVNPPFGGALPVAERSHPESLSDTSPPGSMENGRIQCVLRFLPAPPDVQQKPGPRRNVSSGLVLANHG